MSWRVQLIQKPPGDTPRWFTGRVMPNWIGGLTAMPRMAATYSTEQGAKDAAANLPKHSWGTWEAREFSQGDRHEVPGEAEETQPETEGVAL